MIFQNKQRVKLYNRFKKIEKLINEFNVFKNIINFDEVEKEYNEKIALYKDEQLKIIYDINIETKTEKQLLNKKIEQTVNDFISYKINKKIDWELIESYKDMQQYLYTKKEAVIMKKNIEPYMKTEKVNHKLYCAKKKK